ncbi:MAG: PleD family two-component system response regulator [Anaerolineae bacterium]
MNWSVLVIHEEPLFLAVVRLMLEPAGAIVLGAENGPDALEKMRQEQPDMVILALKRADVDDSILCEWLRREGGTADLPIIVVGAGGRPQEDRQNDRDGAIRYLPSPMSRNDLLRHLFEVIRGSPAGERLAYARSHQALAR